MEEVVPSTTASGNCVNSGLECSARRRRTDSATLAYRERRRSRSRPATRRFHGTRRDRDGSRRRRAEVDACPNAGASWRHRDDDHFENRFSSELYSRSPSYASQASYRRRARMHSRDSVNYRLDDQIPTHCQDTNYRPHPVYCPRSANGSWLTQTEASAASRGGRRRQGRSSLQARLHSSRPFFKNAFYSPFSASSSIFYSCTTGHLPHSSAHTPPFNCFLSSGFLFQPPFQRSETCCLSRTTMRSTAG